MKVTVDIHEPIEVICRSLGLVPANVAELHFTPTTVTATLYKLNGNGSKYVDEKTDRAATETAVFEVKT